MSKRNNALKSNSYLSQCLTEFFNKLVGMNIIAKSKVKNAEKALWELLMQTKETIYRAVDHDYYTQDLMNKINEYYGNKGSLVAKCIPKYILDGIIEDWQYSLGNTDLFWEINWEILENRLNAETWLSDLGEFTHREISIYRCYLTDWYRNHQEGDPVCIRDFFDCKMKDADMKNYYLSLTGKRGVAMTKKPKENQGGFKP